MRHYPLLLLTGLLAWSCTPLAEEEPPGGPENLVALTELPAEYGELIAVTRIPNPRNRMEWYELWFSHPETGRITHVPVWRQTWSYAPDWITVIDRTPAASNEEASQEGGAP